jgi:Protein phosphatase 2C
VVKPAFSKSASNDPGHVLQESGTTATVAALVGWTVVVANVGDSLAYLDTGSEVVQVGPPAPQSSCCALQHVSCRCSCLTCVSCMFNAVASSTFILPILSVDMSIMVIHVPETEM